MGLAVLPGRLKFELDEIMKFLTGEQKFDPTLHDKNHPLYKHIPWVEELLLKYGNKCTKEEAESYIQQEVGNKFLQVLFDAGVFKSCLLYTSPSPRDRTRSRMPSSA